VKFYQGGEGAAALAEKVVETIDKNPNPNVQPILCAGGFAGEQDESVAQKSMALRESLLMTGAGQAATVQRLVFCQAACMHRQDTVLIL